VEPIPGLIIALGQLLMITMKFITLHKIGSNLITLTVVQKHEAFSFRPTPNSSRFMIKTLKITLAA
jgi:hypothetical protein